MSVYSAVVSRPNESMMKDTKSSIKSKHGEFINVLMTMARAYNTNEEVTFSLFPDNPVSPTDPSFELFAVHSFNELDKQLQMLLKTEEWKSKFFEQGGKLFG